MVEAVLCSRVFAATTSRELLVWLIGEALHRRTARRHPGLRILSDTLCALDPDSPVTRRVIDLAQERGTGLDVAPPGAATIPEPPASRDGEENERNNKNNKNNEDGDNKDFFISYTAADRRWAVWIAWELEEAGYGVLVQEWTSCRAAADRWAWSEVSPNATAR